MAIKGIIIGQRVTEHQKEAARILRRNMTPAEKELWQHLRANHLGGFHFRRQQIILDFIVDFYCHEAALVVEVDGGVHEKRRIADTERDGMLSEIGLRVMRVSNNEVLLDTGEVLRRIEDCCRMRSRTARTRSE